MSEVDRLTSELAAAIKNSDEYKNYLHCKALLERYPDVFREVNQLRKQNFALQNDNNISGMYDAVDEFSRRFADLRKQDYVSDFLAAELCVCRMAQEITHKLVEEIDFDTSFLES